MRSCHGSAAMGVTAWVSVMQCGGTGGKCDDGGHDVRVGGERDGEVMAVRRWGWRRAYRGWVWLCHDAVHGMAMSEVVGSCHGSAAMGVRRAYWR